MFHFEGYGNTSSLKTRELTCLKGPTGDKKEGGDVFECVAYSVGTRRLSHVRGDSVASGRALGARH